MGGEEIINILRTASHIDAIRIRVDAKHRKKTIPIGEPFELSEKAAKQARSLFAERDSYLDGSSMCLFDPGVKLVFRHRYQVHAQG